MSNCASIIFRIAAAVCLITIIFEIIFEVNFWIYAATVVTGVLFVLASIIAERRGGESTKKPLLSVSVPGVGAYEAPGIVTPV
jgi:hypothetical protein